MTQDQLMFALLLAVLLSLVAELRGIRLALRNGIRTFHLPVRLAFINRKGQEIFEMQVQDSGQQVLVQLSKNGVDAAGNSAPLDASSVPQFSLDQAVAGSLKPVDGDPFSVVFVPAGQLGSFNVDVQIPAVNQQVALAGSLQVQVVAGPVVTLSISGSLQPSS